MRKKFRGHPQFERTEQFCAVYEYPAFDPKLERAPLGFFEPMLQRLFNIPKNSVYREAARDVGMVD